MEQVVEGGSPGSEVEVSDEQQRSVDLSFSGGGSGIGKLAGAQLEVDLSDGWHAVHGDEMYGAGGCLNIDRDCRDPGQVSTIRGCAEGIDLRVAKWQS